MGNDSLDSFTLYQDESADTTIEDASQTSIYEKLQSSDYSDIAEAEITDSGKLRIKGVAKGKTTVTLYLNGVSYTTCKVTVSK